MYVRGVRVLGIKPRVSCLLGKYSAIKAMPPSPGFLEGEEQGSC
jgi:hypothetical protein